MRRLARWTLNALTALSLVLCAVAVLLHYYEWHIGSWSVWNAQGWVQAKSLLPPTDPRTAGPSYRYGDEEFIEVSAQRIPEKEGSRFGVGGFYERYVSFPEWLMFLSGALPASWFVAWLWVVLYARRIGRQVYFGRCPSCHYDLTGNVSGVCPECGAAACTTNT